MTAADTERPLGAGMLAWIGVYFFWMPFTESNTAACTIAAVRVLVIGSVPPAEIVANMTLCQCVTTSSARNTPTIMSTRTGTITEKRTAILRWTLPSIFNVVIELSPAPIGFFAYGTPFVGVAVWKRSDTIRQSGGCGQTAMRGIAAV